MIFISIKITSIFDLFSSVTSVVALSIETFRYFSLSLVDKNVVLCANAVQGLKNTILKC